MQGSPDAKKPCKGILKTSSSFDKHSSAAASRRKSAKFDELNVLQTYHPADKDYGHMKIEEPKTPYNYDDPDLNNVDQLDAELLAEKLQVAADTRTSSNEESSEEDEDESDDRRARRLEFERRRKAHYNEFEAVRIARKLIEEEGDEDEDDVKPSNKLTEKKDEREKDEMETEEKEDAQNTSPSSEH